MNPRIPVPVLRARHGVGAAFRWVPLPVQVVTGVTVLAYAGLLSRGITWWVALGTVVTADVIGYMVFTVPRQMILANDMDEKTPEEQEQLLRDAADARREYRNYLISVGEVDPVDGEEAAQ